MRMSWEQSLPLVLAGSLLIAGVAFGLDDRKSPPTPPTPAELARIASCFHAVRPTLDTLVSLNARRSGLARGWSGPDSLHVRSEIAKIDLVRIRIHSQLRRRLDRLGQRFPTRTAAPHSDLLSVRRLADGKDTVVTVMVWGRRGVGASPPWWYAGYEYSTQSPIDPPPDRPGPPQHYVHLTGNWYVYSECPLCKETYVRTREGVTRRADARP